MTKDTEGPKKELEKLEKAAEQAVDAEEIQQKAEGPQNETAPKTPPFWFVPYLIAAAVFGLGIFLLDWKESVFLPSVALKIHRYLLGALGVVGVLAFAKGLQFYAIDRV